MGGLVVPPSIGLERVRSGLHDAEERGAVQRSGLRCRRDMRGVGLSDAEFCADLRRVVAEEWTVMRRPVVPPRLGAT